MASADAEHKAAYATATSVPDVNLTSAVLMAGARHLGQFCGSGSLRAGFEQHHGPCQPHLPLRRLPRRRRRLINRLDLAADALSCAP